ncbi:ATP-binding cassette domain-containing protein [Streptomyces sp. AD55]|uniref:ATP-binding cassette domain-containing protein n=1 Tax=Streptomyces sp. AD55 TaxID=3242895 RepID=UPI003528D2E6
MDRLAVSAIWYRSAERTVAYLDPVTTRCEGRRFKESVLQHRVPGKNIADVLEMSMEEAGEFFLSGPLRAKANAQIETGIGHLGLGQSLATLSGGERRRLKLADRLSGSGTVYILDEPTTGLHLCDIDNLVGLRNRIVDRGNTVIVIEHGLAVISQADWVIDLGPEGGDTGGEIVSTGTPADLAPRGGALTHRAASELPPVPVGPPPRRRTADGGPARTGRPAVRRTRVPPASPSS